jgi:hypothetical protein
VEAILKLSQAKTKRQLRHFLGVINYYRDMWQKRSHMLALLTGLVCPIVKYKWGEEQQKAFDEIKQKVSQDTFLHFLTLKRNFMCIVMHPTISWEQSLCKKGKIWPSIAES